MTISWVIPLTRIKKLTQNDLNHIALGLRRSSADFGVLIYRQEQAAGGISTAITSSKLIGIACDKDFGGSNTTTWKDYGNYDQTAWSTKGSSNEFDADQIHFPNVARTGSGRGWAIDSVVEVGTGYIKLGNGYGLNNNLGFGRGNLNFPKALTKLSSKHFR